MAQKSLSDREIKQVISSRSVIVHTYDIGGGRRNSKGVIIRTPKNKIEEIIVKKEEINGTGSTLGTILEDIILSKLGSSNIRNSFHFKVPKHIGGNPRKGLVAAELCNSKNLVEIFKEIESIPNQKIKGELRKEHIKRSMEGYGDYLYALNKITGREIKKAIRRSTVREIDRRRTEVKYHQTIILDLVKTAKEFNVEINYKKLLKEGFTYRLFKKIIDIAQYPDIFSLEIRGDDFYGEQIGFEYFDPKTMDKIANLQRSILRDRGEKAEKLVNEIKGKSKLVIKDPDGVVLDNSRFAGLIDVVDFLGYFPMHLTENEKLEGFSIFARYMAHLYEKDINADPSRLYPPIDLIRYISSARKNQDTEAKQTYLKNATNLLDKEQIIRKWEILKKPIEQIAEGIEKTINKNL